MSHDPCDSLRDTNTLSSNAFFTCFAVKRGFLKVLLRSPSLPLFSLFQGAFPARLKKVLIVGAPVWFRVPYNLLSLLLKEKLRERVSWDERWSSPGASGGTMTILAGDRCCVPPFITVI